MRVMRMEEDEGGKSLATKLTLADTIWTTRKKHSLRHNFTVPGPSEALPQAQPVGHPDQMR